MTNENFHYFSGIGFFEEKTLALKCLKDLSDTLSEDDVEYCLMFGTLLGKLRHDDFIPWDDDIDIIIFDTKKFETKCLNKLEKMGYTVLTDRRQVKNSDPDSTDDNWLECGYRIYPNQGLPIHGQSWKFPWVGVWIPSYNGTRFTLAPEEHIYQTADFFPLRKIQFQGFSVTIPHNSSKVLTSYFKADNWMEFCVPPDLNHREYKKTNAPNQYFPLADVLEYLGNLEPLLNLKIS
jgi:hypothetical protein